MTGDGRAPIASVNGLTVRWAAAACRGTESVVLSGAGVWPLLAFLAAGAAGAGRAELERAVGVNAADAAPAARAVLETLEASSAVRSALGLWTGAGLTLRPEWVGQIPADARGELTGDPDRDRERLDAWAGERTDGLIPALPVTVDEDTRLVLAGALTVDTTWDQPFTEGPEQISSGPWAGRRIAALRRSTWALEDLRAADTPGGPLTMLRVTGSGEIDVHLLLAEPDRPAAEVLAAGAAALAGRHPVADGSALPEGEAAPGVVVRVLESFTPGDLLHQTVPRFTVASSHDLLRTAEVFGLQSVTDTARGHFPGISAEPLALGQGRQDALASFQALGFRAAAVTAFSGVVGAAPSRDTHRVRHVGVAFCRPFGFLAVHRTSGLILTAGWVAEPEPPTRPERRTPVTDPPRPRGAGGGGGTRDRLGRVVAAAVQRAEKGREPAERLVDAAGDRRAARPALEETLADPAARYRDAVRAAADAAEAGTAGVDGPSPGTVTGLGECGTADDLALPAPLLEHSRPAVRAEAVRAIRRLGGPPAPLAALLTDPAPAVVRAVTRALRDEPGVPPTGRLWELLSAARPRHVRRGAHHLLRSRGAWARVEADLLLMTDGDPEPAARGRADLTAWPDGGHAAVYAPLPAAARDRVHALLAAAAPALGPDRTRLLHRLVTTAGSGEEQGVRQSVRCRGGAPPRVFGVAGGVRRGVRRSPEE